MIGNIYSYFYKPILILDLDNTLIYTYYMDETNIKFNYRPGLINFLNIIKIIIQFIYLLLLHNHMQIIY